MYQSSARTPTTGGTKPTPKARRTTVPRTSPLLRQRIEKLASQGWTYAEIARDCQVSRATAHKYGAALRPKPDHLVHLNQLETANLRDLARHAVRVTCPRCLIPALGFAFIALTRCTSCGTAIVVPLPSLRPPYRAAPRRTSRA